MTIDDLHALAPISTVESAPADLPGVYSLILSCVGPS